MSELQAFETWLLGRGRSSETATLYVADVRLCLADEKGLKGRLLGKRLAPSTKRHNLAALRAWARFQKDEALLLELGDLKLDVPEAVVEKVPLSDKEWSKIEIAIEAMDDEVVSACLSMICIRGFRVGAIPALTRKQIKDGLETKVLVFESKRRTVKYSVKPFRHCLELLLDGLVTERKKTVGDLLCPDAENSFKAARGKLQRWIRVVGQRAGIPCQAMYPHRLRRTYASAFYQETKDIAALKQHMGWASLDTALGYVDHDRREELDQAADNMRKRRKQ